MSKPEKFIGYYDIDFRMLEIHGDAIKHHSNKEMAFKIGLDILNKFPPKEKYVYYSKIDGSYKAFEITSEKLSDDECRRRGIYLTDVRLEVNLEVRDDSR